MRGFKIANWGAETPVDVPNAAGRPLFEQVELNWARPTFWRKGEGRPTFDCDEPFVYALVHNHGNARTRDRIVYIGLTTSPRTRFGNHERAAEIVSRRGEVKFSYAPVKLSGRNLADRIGPALEEIEHLLIWAAWPNLENEKKMFTLPGMGTNGGNAWHIINKGYRFAGQMPREIAYPWMIVKPGRVPSAR